MPIIYKKDSILTKPLNKVPFSAGIAARQKGAYRGYSQYSKVTTGIFNSILASVLLVLASPLFLFIAFIIKRKSTGSIFYSGVRLGINKKPFFMHKFRTLPMGAQERIGTEYMSYTHFKLPAFFDFLRDTHLDELPQLFNILKGEMSFIGPRPLRPEIYENLCKNITNFDLRFTVKPGLTGYSQVLTPNGHLKRMSALIDNRSIHSKTNSVSHISLFFLSVFYVLNKSFAMAFFYLRNRRFKSILLNSLNELRALDRINQKNACALIYQNPIGDKAKIGNGILVDMNEEYLKMKTNTKLDRDKYLLRLRKKMKRGNRVRCKSALCKGLIFRGFRLEEEPYRYAYVIKYHPLSGLNRYMVHQYFLEKGMLRLFW